MHKIVVGLGFGDEAKGATVDWMCATGDVKAVIRYNGGPQAAHNVVTAVGEHHQFSQFGAGTFQGVPTHLSEHMLVNPFNMVNEAEHLMSLGLPDPFLNTTVSWDALLVTPYHRAANRLKEDARGHARHGSTGQGVGETRWYDLEFPHTAPHISDMGSPYVMNRLLETLRDYYTATLGDLGVKETPRELTMMYLDLYKNRMNIVPSDYVETLLDSGDCVFEGAQGVLLDELYGFNPHTTWTNTTQANARKLLRGREAECWGLTRAYHTRHGAGPFPSEAKTAISAPEPHNGTGQYQGAWRVGELDLTLLEYAIRANGGIDKLSVSHLDYMYDVLMESNYGYDTYSGEIIDHLPLPTTRDESFAFGATMSSLRSRAYDLVEGPDDVIRQITEVVGIAPTLLSYGPTWKDRKLANVPTPA